MFGASGGMDSFVAAFRIPNLLRDLFAEGALSAAYVPVFTEKLKKEGVQRAFAITSSIFSILLLFLGIIVILGIILAPVYVKYYVAGFGDSVDQIELTENLTRIMFPFILLVAFAAVSMGTLNSIGRFGIPALAPAVFNLIMILSALFLSKYTDPPIIALAIGALLGGLGQFLIQMPQLLKSGYRFRFKLNLKDSAVTKILKLMVPAAMGVAAWQVNVVIATIIASYLAKGSISNLYYALRLMHFPLGVFGIALASVSLPEISALAAKNDLKGAGSAQRYSSRMVVFLLLPSAAYLFGASDTVVSAVYQRGNFEWANTVNVALALRAYTVGLLFFGLVRVTAQVFYAFKDTATPVKISFVAVAVNITLSLLFVGPFGFAGLAFATSISAIVNFSLLNYFSHRKAEVPDKTGLIIFSSKITIASLAVGFCGYVIPKFFMTNNQFIDYKMAIPAVIVSAVVSGIIYLAFSRIFKIEELKHLSDAFLNRK
jgi:putative peptidoglycan lipid II flippase